MSGDLMTAAEARARIERTETHAAQAQILDIKTKISNAVERAGSSITVERLLPNVANHLRTLGYRIEYHQSLDQRDDSYHEVSW